MRRIGLALLLVLGCSGGGGDSDAARSITEAEAEQICQDYCSSERSPICSIRTVEYQCGTPPTDPQICSLDEAFTGEACVNVCLMRHQEVCGELHTARKVCELELGCNDELNDCAVWDEQLGDCVRDAQLRSRCAALCPDTVDACVAAGGVCPAGT